MERIDVMRSSQSEDETVVHVEARPKQQTVVRREQDRAQIHRTRSKSRGRALQEKRKEQGANMSESEISPIRHRSESVGLADTPIGQGPSTALMSPRRYSELGATSGEQLELHAPLRMTGTEDHTDDQP